MLPKSPGRQALLAVTLLVPTLASCAATMDSVGISARKSETERALCEAFQPLAWSARDTDETIQQAKAHNAVGVRVCGWKGGK